MVQKRVVMVERLESNAVALGHFFASVIWNDRIYLLAVFVWHRHAQGLVRHEIRALIVDSRVQNHELIATTGDQHRPEHRMWAVLRTGKHLRPGKSSHKIHRT